MGNQTIQRRLAAIVAADVAGYTRLMERDEDGTVAAWHTARSGVIDPSISSHSGRIVKHTGDGFLAEFQTVQDAVRCTVAMQQGLADAPLEFRMGVNIGDIVDDGEDIHGDGVNVAARLESIAEPGGVCVSGDVYSQVRRRLDYQFEDMGEQEMKHISMPIRAYKLIIESKFGEPKLALPNKPSIAVLAFDNLSGDPEQDYFSDGIAEDIITDLSKITDLLVIARNSSFTFRGQNIGVKEIGEQLGVKFILEGSVRKAGNKIRINAQLVDAPTNGHVWAERYDRDLEDIFAVQDEITSKIVSALEVNLRPENLGDTQKSARSDVGTYDLYMRARRIFYLLNPDSLKAAKGQLEAVLDKDPNFAPAYALLSYCYFTEWCFVATLDDSVLEKARELAERAVEIDQSAAYAHARLGWILAFIRKYDDALNMFETAFKLAPNDAEVLSYYGETLNYADQPERGLEMVEKGIRLDPLGPPNWEFHRGHSYYKMRRHEEAIASIRHSISRSPDFPISYLYLAVLYSELGRSDEAAQTVKDALDRAPNFSIVTIKKVIPHKSTEESQRFLDGLRSAGMPEG